MSESVNSAAPQEELQSTLAAFFKLGFSIVGDSRDFSNDSIQVVLARGYERITWVFPMKKGVLGVSTDQGSSYLKVAPQDISFDVVLPVKQ